VNTLLEAAEFLLVAFIIETHSISTAGGCWTIQIILYVNAG